MFQEAIEIDSVITLPIKPSSIDPFNDGSLIAKYELDGDLTGIIGASLTSNDITFSNGVFGTCVETKGTDSSHLVFNHTFSNNESVSLWINPLEFIGDTCIGSYDSNNYFIGTHPDYCIVGNNGDETFKFVPETMLLEEVNRFYHFVLTNDGNGIKVYKDSVELTNTITSAEATAGWNNSTFLNKLGGYHTDSHSAKMLIDQVEIYNRALTLEEINSLYNQNDYLKCTKSYQTLRLSPGRTLETQVEFNGSGNKMTKISATILKEE